MKRRTVKLNSQPYHICQRLTASCLLCCLVFSPACLTAEDSDLMRPYFHLRRGEFNYTWGPEDMWGLGLGLNLNRYWGVELALDTWEEKMSFAGVAGGDVLGEEAATSFIPQIRFRYPLFRDRLVPYVVAGFGGAFYQFNDRKSDGFGRQIDADGAGWAASLGAGLDWFVADNIALNFEAKQIWHSSLDVTVDGEKYEYDPSDWVATIGFRVFFRENHPKPLIGRATKAPTRIYLGFRAGGSILTDDQWNNGVYLQPEAAAWGDFNHHFGGSVGIDFGRYWGLELAADGGEYTVQMDSIGAVAEYAFSAIMPQLRLRLPISEGRWVPYLMGGAGISYGEVNDYKPASVGVEFDGKGVYPAFALGAGIEYFIARNISLSAETRWLYTWDHKYELNGVSARGDFSHLQLMLALRLYLFEF